MIRLEALLDNWKSIRQDTAQAVLDMPAGELNLKATPELSSFREIALHILNSCNGFIGLLLDGEENLADPAARERMRKYFVPLPADVDAATLAAALREAIEARAPELAKRSPEWWAHMITRVDGQRATRMEMLQMAKEHELTHRSQLFLYLRLKGVVPVTTRRRMAKPAAR